MHTTSQKNHFIKVNKVSKKIVLINTFALLFLLTSCSNATSENASTSSSIETVIAEETISVENEIVAAPEEEIVEIEEEKIETAKPTGTTTPIKKEVIKEQKIVIEKKEAKPTIEEPIVETKIEAVRANHTTWDELTNKYVTSSGKVNYKGMKADVSQIKSYIEHLASTPVQNDWSKNEALAYWFNLYNASTVYLIVQQYPIKSITDLEGGKPWDKKFIKSGDKTYSLNDIENVIVRPKYNEPLVHVAFNCAAVSCPSLLKGAFLPEKLTAQLTAQAKAWVNDTSKNKISTDKVEVSQIFDWYGKDFTGVGGVVGFLNKYSNNKANEGATVSFLAYNWALNE